MKSVSIIGGIFVGGISLLEPDGHRTGIFKHAIGRASVTKHGLEGDLQADRRFHGGPEKAVHHYPADHYARLRGDYPRLARELVPGSLGENLSTFGWTERTVHIGDVFRIGGVLLQVSQPRSPCWKINHRFGVDDLSRWIASNCLTGWYYRVLRPGIVALGDSFERVDQAPDPISIAHFWQVVLAHRPSANDLQRVGAISALSDGWKKRLRERKAWLAGAPAESIA